MFAAIYEGILLGLFLAFSIGPSFFALINTGISYGFRAGATLAIGIFFSDLFFILVTVSLIQLGMADLLTEPRHQAFIGVIGGIVLIVYGAFHFVNRQVKTDDENVVEIKSPRAYLLFMKGFFLNMFNPFVWIFWIATATAISTEYQFKVFKVIIFFASVLAMVISTDLLKTFVAHKIKAVLNVRILTLVRHISGGLLILFGLYLIYKVFFLHGKTI
jgi:threonine/homoserine/homoserine lactone efflux protein